MLNGFFFKSTKLEWEIVLLFILHEDHHNSIVVIELRDHDDILVLDVDFPFKSTFQSSLV